jgi:peptidyl-prolyl cis-trans isomerase D
VITVQGDLGLAVVKVIAATPGHSVTLEELKPMLEAEIRKDMAAEKAYAQAEAFEDARQGGANMTDAATKAGVQSQRTPPITAQGAMQNGQPTNLPPKILQVAFSLPAGGESEVTELGQGVSFAVRVEKVIPAHVPPLEEIRPQVTAVWTQRELVKALEAKAKTLAARIEKGESIDAVAASAGVPVTRVPGLSRQNAQAHPEVPQPVLGRAFGSKPGEVWTARAPQALVVGRIDNVRMDPNPSAAQLAESSRAQLSQAVSRELGTAAQVYARNKLKTKVDPVRARAAAGFEPLAKGKAKTPEKKG